MTSTQEIVRYNAVARALHWLIALIIIGNIIGGLAHDALEDVFNVMPLHKSLGLLVLALSVFRLAWRLTNKPPALPDTMPGWERGTAHVLVWIFYAAMIIVPLSGWVMSSAGKYPLNFFGLFDVPKFAVAPKSALAGAAHETHEIFGLLLIPLILLHVGAALRHHFVLRDDTLRRMLRG